MAENKVNQTNSIISFHLIPRLKNPLDLIKPVSSVQITYNNFSRNELLVDYETPDYSIFANKSWGLLNFS